MKIPWVLRLEIAWAALRGRVVNIALQAGTPVGTIYRFGFVQKDLKHWRARHVRLGSSPLPTVGPTGGAGNSGAHFDYKEEDPDD